MLLDGVSIAHKTKENILNKSRMVGNHDLYNERMKLKSALMPFLWDGKKQLRLFYNYPSAANFYWATQYDFKYLKLVQVKTPFIQVIGWLLIGSKCYNT